MNQPIKRRQASPESLSAEETGTPVATPLASLTWGSESLQLLFERSMTPWLLIDGAGIVAAANGAVAARLGRSIANLIGLPIGALAPACQTLLTLDWSRLAVLLQGEAAWLGTSSGGILNTEPIAYQVIPQFLPGYALLELQGPPSGTVAILPGHMEDPLATLQKLADVTCDTTACDQDLLAVITTATGFPIGLIEHYDRLGQQMVLLDARGLPLPPSPRQTTPVTQTRSGTVALTGQPLVQSFPPAGPPPDPTNLPAHLSTGTWICVPMRVNQQIVGTLSLGHPDPVPVDLVLVQWVTSLAGYVAAIRDRYQTEVALRESEAKAQALATQLRLQSAALAAAANAIVITDRTGAMQWCNPAFTQLTGYTLPEVINRNTCELLQSGLNPPSLYRELWQTILKGEVWHGELINRRKDHRLYTEEMAIAPVTDEQGQITHFVAIKQDVSDRKQAERALRQSQQRYEDLVNSLDGIIWEAEVGADYRFTFVSQTAARMLGYPVTAWLEDPHFWPQHIHPNDRDWVLERCQRVTQANLSHDFEYRMITVDQQVLWFRNIVKVVITSGQPTKLRGVMIDVTDRKQAELSLLSLQGRLQTLLATSPAVIYALNPDDWRQVIFISENLESLLGYDPDRVLAYPDQFWEWVHPDDRPNLNAALTGWLAAGATTCVSHQCRFQTAKGQWRWVNNQLTAIHDETGDIVELVGSLTDVTSQVESDRRLERISRNIPGMIYQYRLRTDGSSHFPYASEGIREVYGVTPEQVQGDASPVFAIIHPGDLAEVQRSILYSAQHLTLWHCEYRVYGPTGQVRWLEGRSTPQQEPDGSVLWHGYITDITERKAIADQQSAILAAIPDLLLHLRRDGTCIECILPFGPQAKQFIPIQAHLSEVLPPALLSEQLQVIEQALATGELQIHEHQFLKHGALIYEEVRVAAINAEEVLVIVRDITVRKQAELAIHHQAERERLMTRITNRIRQSLDVYEVLNTTVLEVRQFLQTDRVLVYRLQPDISGVVIAESVGAGWLSLLNQTLHDPCLQTDTCRQRYIEGHIHNFADLDTTDLPLCYQQMLRQQQIRASLVLPILQGRELWGFLMAQHCAAPRYWQEGEISLLQQLADQVAIALQQSELYAQVQLLNSSLEQQVQERTAQLQQSLSFESLLKRITDKVRDSLDESQILSSTIQELATELQVECCDASLYNADHTRATIAYEYTRTLTSALGATFTLADSPHPELYPALLQGQVCQFCDLAPTPLRPNQYQLSILACPIVDDQGVLGDLWLFRRREQVFSEPEIRLVQQVANQCAIALRQSRLYQAAQSQVTELERLNRLKDDFLSTVSHELRTPMANIKMATQMLGLLLGLIGVETTDDEQTVLQLDAPKRSRIGQYFQILAQECQREISLISDLLDLTRLDAGKITLHPTSLDLSIWLPRLLQPFQARTRQQRQSLDLHLAAPLPSIRTDIPSLERILSELLHNACKYTPPDEAITVTVQGVGESPSAQVSPSLAEPTAPPVALAASLATAVEIAVSNSGTEIPVAEYDRIFEKFYRIPRHDPWQHGGTGLGLALVKKLVERIGGTIAVHSAQQQVNFVITLPLNLEALA
ncbi:PAS domain S-box protein [Trichothermofontia sp.]